MRNIYTFLGHHSFLNILKITWKLFEGLYRRCIGYSLLARFHRWPPAIGRVTFPARSKAPDDTTTFDPFSFSRRGTTYYYVSPRGTITRPNDWFLVHRACYEQQAIKFVMISVLWFSNLTVGKNSSDLVFITSRAHAWAWISMEELCTIYSV